MQENGARKVRQTFSLDADLMAAMEKAAGYEPLSSFVNRKLREAMGLPAN